MAVTFPDADTYDFQLVSSMCLKISLDPHIFLIALKTVHGAVQCWNLPGLLLYFLGFP